MHEGVSTSLASLAMSLSEASDFVSPHSLHHHKQVAYISSAIAGQLGERPERQADILLAALLHDVATPSLHERLCDLKSSLNTTFRHAEAGWLFLKEYEPFQAAAPMVRFHHLNWDQNRDTSNEAEAQRGSQVLHLADHVSSLLKKNPGLDQTDSICRNIESESDKMFDPDLVNVFLELAGDEAFWLDMVSSSLSSRLARLSSFSSSEANDRALLKVAKLFAQMLDFRSPYTATHSSGVAACAEALARVSEMPDEICTQMRIAGYLHDLGKLSVPVEILEKSGQLNDEERRTVRAHAYHTQRILENIEPLREAYSWAASHHERIDGSGYPSRILGGNLHLWEKIMAVADTFIALTEDRPHRGRIDKGEALSVVLTLARDGKLDLGVSWLLESHFDEVYYFSMAAQVVAGHEYRQFVRDLFAEEVS